MEVELLVAVRNPIPFKASFIQTSLAGQLLVAIGGSSFQSALSMLPRSCLICSNQNG